MNRRKRLRDHRPLQHTQQTRRTRTRRPGPLVLRLVDAAATAATTATVTWVLTHLPW
ncbi:hypothetical protein ACWGB8_31775 [Kitasatospora sp. NPDC054939]